MTEWLSVENIASELKVSEETVRAWLRSKKLVGYRLGRDYRIKRGDYEKFLEERRNVGEDKEER